MIDAYTIGIRLALTDDVSAGVARMHGSLAGLNRATRATELRISSLSDLTRRGMEAAEAGARRLGRGGMASWMAPRRSRGSAEPGSPPASPPVGAARAARLLGRSTGSSGRRDRLGAAGAWGPIGDRRGGPTGGDHETRRSGTVQRRTPAIPNASKRERAVRSGLYAPVQSDRLVPKGTPERLQPSPRLKLRIAPHLELGRSLKRARLAAPAGRNSERGSAPRSVDTGIRAAAAARANLAKPMPAGRRARRPAMASVVSVRVRPTPAVAAGMRSRPNTAGPGSVSPVRATWPSRSMAPGATLPRQRPTTMPATTVPPAADPVPPAVPMEAELILDGVRFGRLVADLVARELNHPHAGYSRPDPRISPIWPGPAVG